jgi:hypothetical protein
VHHLLFVAISMQYRAEMSPGSPNRTENDHHDYDDHDVMNTSSRP